jgi:hypothetical protein
LTKIFKASKANKPTPSPQKLSSNRYHSSFNRNPRLCT